MSPTKLFILETTDWESFHYILSDKDKKEEQARQHFPFSEKSKLSIPAPRPTMIKVIAHPVEKTYFISILICQIYALEGHEDKKLWKLQKTR